VHGHDQYRCNDVSGMMNDQGGARTFSPVRRASSASRSGTRDSIASAADKQRVQRCTASASAKAQSISRAFQYIDIYVHVCRSVY
jgi:hypothetical protein